MKRFIILTSTIRNMGGAQMYAANKMAYYETLGWKPDIYFYNAGPVKIAYLKQFENNFIPELSQPMRVSNRKTIKKVVEKILGENKANDDVLFECHLPHLAYWGEYLAQNAKGKNTVFLLEENLPDFTDGEAAFYEFKVNRKEFLNGGEKRLKKVLKQRYNVEALQIQEYNIQPYCNNVVDYNPIELPKEVSKADYSIISIGRLDKPYIKSMLDEILLFIQRHVELRFNLIIVGGDAKNEMSDYITGLFKEISNAKLFLLGYIVPIPYEWIRIADVAIASSNSVLVSYDEGLPTINIDIHDNMPIGIYGHTTNNLWARQKECQTPIHELLEEILIEKRFAKSLVEHNVIDELAQHLKPHQDMLNDSAQSKEYFDVENMYSLRERVVYRLKGLLRPLYKRIRTNKK